MKTEYIAWIKENYPTKDSAFCACQGASAKMQAVFPELKRERGHVRFMESYQRPHWWCVAESGEIVDPTAHQWDEIISEYIVFVPCPIRGEPIGKCMNCGELCWSKDPGASSCCCSKECNDALMSEYP